MTSLADFAVLNRRLAADEPAAAGAPGAAGRGLHRAHLPARSAGRHAARPRGRDRHARSTALHGADAYAFLLRLACGLESEIAGETEILGQIKQAWRDHETANPLAARRIRPWMQRLLQETKEIRSEHVVNLGSATYGSLARRLLGGRDGRRDAALGAGQLAAMVLPYLACARSAHRQSYAGARLRDAGRAAGRRGGRPAGDGAAAHRKRRSSRPGTTRTTRWCASPRTPGAIRVASRPGTSDASRAVASCISAS